jgi:hypothetical protein
VALTLAGVQLAVCAVTIAVAQAGLGWVLLTGGMMLAAGLVLIWQFERSSLFGRAGAPEPEPEVAAPQLAAEPAISPPTLGAIGVSLSAMDAAGPLKRA